MNFSLPRLMLVTDRRLMRPDFESALTAALEGGARLIQLREKDLPRDEVLTLARRAKTLCDESNARLLINSQPGIAREVGAGLHYPEREIENLCVAWAELGGGVLLGASCHSLEAAWRAQKGGADYLVFGSVFETVSHPDSTPAGVEALREITRQVEIPVFAIGGITVQNARACLEVGAHGVAVISAVWSTLDVAQAVRELTDVLAS